METSMRPMAISAALCGAATACGVIVGIGDLPGTDAGADAAVSDSGGDADGGTGDAPADTNADAMADGPADALADAGDGSDGGGGVPPSCAPGGPRRTTCGDGGESCCASVLVDGGSYDCTYVNDGGGARGLADPATVSSLRIDKYEVTVGRFRQFVGVAEPADGGVGWRPGGGSGKHAHLHGGHGLVNVANDAGAFQTGWLSGDDVNVSPTTTELTTNCYTTGYATWTPTPAGNENRPINCVNWYEAQAFCIWDGAFLPIEAEWEYAAAGGNQQREYPWGSAPPGGASQYAIFNCYYMGGGNCADVTNSAPVGTALLGANPWGALDLASNVGEWTLDRMATYVNPCNDGAYLGGISSPVVRGGDYRDIASALLPTARFTNGPALRLDVLGFRCARSP